MGRAARFIEDFLADLPRGVRSRRLRDQRMPLAHWEPPECILENPALAYDPHKPDGKVLIGALGERLIGIRDDRHILTVAGSRAGKSVTVIGNLFFYDGSVLCTDPKAELAGRTARARAALGQKVFILDPFGRCEKSVKAWRARYNPLALLDPESETLVEDAELIADALVVSTGHEKDPHWNESARNFIHGLILHVVTAPCHEGRRTLVAVRALIRIALMEDEDAPVDAEKKAPRRVEAEMLENAERIAAVLGDEDLASAIEGAARDFYEKTGNEQASVLSTVRRHTKFLDYKAMRRVLSGHDFDLADLKRDPAGISVYLCLPAGRMGACARWLRIFVNQLLDAVERTPTGPGASPVLVCLDEFPVLGFMNQLQDAIGQAASFNLRLWVILQDWGQGKALYGERWESFAANAGVLQAFGNADITTADYLSRRLGKTPVEVTRTGEVGQRQSEAGLTGKSTERQLHNLLTPDEITRAFAREDGLKRQLILWSGRRPMILQRVEYFDQESPAARWFGGKRTPACVRR